MRKLNSKLETARNFSTNLVFIRSERTLIPHIYDSTQSEVSHVYISALLWKNLGSSVFTGLTPVQSNSYNESRSKERGIALKYGINFDVFVPPRN